MTEPLSKAEITEIMDDGYIPTANGWLPMGHVSWRAYRRKRADQGVELQVWPPGIDIISDEQVQPGVLPPPLAHLLTYRQQKLYLERSAAFAARCEPNDRIEPVRRTAISDPPASVEIARERIGPCTAVLARHGISYHGSDRGGTAICPFHEDHHPSLTLYIGRTGTSRYQCFACQAGGDAIDLEGALERGRAVHDPPVGSMIGDLLDQVESFVGRFVRFTNGDQLVTISLYPAHVYAIRAADATPYLHVHSAERASGKTLCLECLQLVLAPRAILTTNATVPAIFRTLDRDDPPALLCDEVDHIFGGKGGERAAELATVLNGGYRRNAVVIRTVGQDFTPHGFRTFGPKVLAGIGEIPETIASRCIPIELRRRRDDEVVDRFRQREARAEGEQIGAALAAWSTDDVVDQLAAARPDLPDELTDRQQEIWEPLFAIADLAGGDWPKRSRAAAVALHQTTPERSLGELLLEHLRDIFDDRGTDRLTTTEILDALVHRDDGPWPGWWAKDVTGIYGNPLGPGRRVASLLQPYHIKPRSVRSGPGAGTARGYVREDFEDSWSRYVPGHVEPDEGA